MTHDIEDRRWEWTFSLALLCGACAGGGEPLTVGGGAPKVDASGGSRADVSTGSSVDAATGTPIDAGSSFDASTGSPPDSGVGSRPDVGDAAPPCPPMQELFQRDVQPALAYCRSCHVPAGIADTALGRRFMLSAKAGDDDANLRASWERLGRNAPVKSLLLTMPSGTAGRMHSGGTPWPVDSNAYRKMEQLLMSFADPQMCDGRDGGIDAGPEWPLLGSARGGHIWSSFCQDRPDDTLLPPDPRRLVQSGVNAGKATHFNAYWVDCPKGSEPRDAPPKTCGEYRSRYARGKALMEGGNMGFFAGSDPRGLLAISATTYNDLWRVWGLFDRPSDFDERVASRWGIPLARQRNPYPLPGEDPNLTNGGSGQLPTALTQMREDDGRYSGMIAFNCHWCHSGQVGHASEGSGLGPMYGTNSLVELGAAFRD
jgi:endo-cleaving rubber dioxygenase